MIGAPSGAEQRIRAACDTKDFRAAATALLEVYRQEVFAFLLFRLRTRAAAEDAFSMFSEDVWIGLPAFGWRCSARTWAYTLARNAAHRYIAANQAAQPTLVFGAAGPELRQTAPPTTQAHVRTTMRDRIRALRERLDPDEQALLVLRVDRGLAWRDLAFAMSGSVDLSPIVLEREAARLRKTFERIKDELRRLAIAEGLIQRGDTRGDST